MRSVQQTSPFSRKGCRLAVAVTLLALVQVRAFATARVLIIAGKGGTAEYTEKFKGLTERLRTALIYYHNFAPEQITMLSEGVETPSAGRLPCNAHNVEQAVANIGQSMQSQDRLFVILIGHGSADGIVAKFNLPGPDLRDLDFARILELLPARRQVFINTTAASGGFIEKLSRPDRIIITATRGPEENFATKFPEFFVEALEHSDVVDLNKDHQISLLEVFDYARDQVVRFYEQANRLRPEHPLLDDNGDGAGSETPMAVVPVSNQGASTLHLDGALAAQVLWTARAAAISSVPAAASAAENTLIARKMKLLLEIEALKTQKASLPIAEYERNLEALFIELAKLNREIKKTASP